MKNLITKLMAGIAVTLIITAQPDAEAASIEWGVDK